MQSFAFSSLGLFRRSYGVAAFFLLATIFPIHAQDAATTELIRQLQQRIEQLERKVQMLEGSNGVAAIPSSTNLSSVQVVGTNEVRQVGSGALASDAKQGKDLPPKISLGEKGFSLASGDGAFAVSLRGLLQIDSRTFFDDGGTAGNDSLILRRARPIFSGTVFRDFDFLFAPDFGGNNVQIFDAYLNYKYKPWLQVRTGKVKSPIGLEYLTADQFTPFTERGLPTSLVPGRDLGAMLHGEVSGGFLSYALGLFNGLGNGRNSQNSDFDDNKALEGRVFFQPWKNASNQWVQGFGFGVGGSYESMQRTNTLGLPVNYSTSGQQQYFVFRNTTLAQKDHWRLAPQGYYNVGPFSILGEYTISDQEVFSTAADQSARMHHSAWQVSAGWILTGEKAGYNEAIVPKKPFNPSQGGWGALQLVARYGELTLDSSAFSIYADPASSARSISEWAVGLNWWLNRNIRVAASYSHAEFNGGGGPGSSAPAAVTREGEDVLFTRVQLSF